MTLRNEAERALFEKFGAVDPTNLPAIFLLGSPRTGSTLVYQALVHGCRCTCFTNLINDEFGDHPVLGAAIQLAFYAADDPASPSPQSFSQFSSHYGKTSGPFGPSEASHVFRRWFGGNHPAQIASKQILPEQREHMLDTYRAIWGMAQVPVIAKNAWNCFRVENLVQLLPASRFLWIRRDLRASAISDLEARYRRGSPTTWNSATTANHAELAARPHWEQVVEQQVEFNIAIRDALTGFAPDRHSVVWYEDLCADPDGEVHRLADELALSRTAATLPSLSRSAGPTIPADDLARIQQYLDADEGDRFAPHSYRPPREN